MLNKKALAASVSAGPAVYVDDVFSTFLYTGTNAAQTINNGIDLAGKGGLVWIKSRNFAFTSLGHVLADTVRGRGSYLASQTTDAAVTSPAGKDISSFNSNGFTVNTVENYNLISNESNYCSWTFREQAKFFDVVTYTGDGAGSRNINHDLGSAPGMIIIKRTNGTQDWAVWHRGNGTNWLSDLSLNTTSASGNSQSNTAVTSTTFNTQYVTTAGGTGINASGGTYVAYLFAHDAGGFGTTGTDNVISCGSWTTSGSGNFDVNLGYEPQWLLVKRSDADSNWFLVDNMRGFNNCSADTGIGETARPLNPNLANAESSGQYLGITTTGFNAAFSGAGSKSYIYMAIRRPMKPPTSGTQVFAPITYTTNGSALSVTTGLNAAQGSLIITKSRPQYGFSWYDNLRGAVRYIDSTSTSGDNTLASTLTSFNMNGVSLGANDNSVYGSGASVLWNFQRASEFFDIVCWDGGMGNTNRRITHNLTVAPELIITKTRTNAADWWTYTATTGTNSLLALNRTDASTAGGNPWTTSAPTATDFGMNEQWIGSSGNWVAYLFATLAGVSKVGSYTGNGSTQTINCGFTAGARFVMVKATSTTGDWVIVDTARGLVSGDDPFLELNTTGAEQTQDIVDPANSGFIVNETTEAINTNGASYIFLAVA